MANFAPRMGDPHGDPQTSPQHADPHGFLVWFSLKRHHVHVDRRVVGRSAGRHVDHPCGGQISPWPARKVTDSYRFCLPSCGKGNSSAFRREVPTMYWQAVVAHNLVVRRTMILGRQANHKARAIMCLVACPCEFSSRAILSPQSIA